MSLGALFWFFVIVLILPKDPEWVLNRIIWKTKWFFFCVFLVFLGQYYDNITSSTNLPFASSFDFLLYYLGVATLILMFLRFSGLLDSADIPETKANEPGRSARARKRQRRKGARQSQE